MTVKFAGAAMEWTLDDRFLPSRKGPLAAVFIRIVKGRSTSANPHRTNAGAEESFILISPPDEPVANRFRGKVFNQPEVSQTIEMREQR